MIFRAKENPNGKFLTQRRKDAETQRKIPKGFNHSARRWPMKSGYAGIIGKIKSTLKGLD
jgi:hypothetical protein